MRMHNLALTFWWAHEADVAKVRTGDDRCSGDFRDLVRDGYRTEFRVDERQAEPFW